MAIDKNYQPKFYRNTSLMTVSEWEDARRNSLGGSDMAVILGLSPYEITKRDIFYQKIGKKPIVQPPETQKIIFNAGHFLENMVSNLFSYRTGYDTYEIKAMFEHPRHPYLRGNIDRFYRRRGEKTPLGLLECKTTSEFKSSEWADGKIPTQYKVQISTYMSITNMDSCKISCLMIPESLRWVAGILYQMKSVFGALPKNTLGDIKDSLNAINDANLKPYVPLAISAIGGEMSVPEHLLEDCSNAINSKLVITDYERDECLEEIILQKAEEFWKEYVEKKVEPSLEGEKGSAAISTINKYIAPKKVSVPIALPDGDMLAELKEEIDALKLKKSALNARAKALDARIEKLSVPFIEALNGAPTGVYECDGKQISVSYQPGSVRKTISRQNLERMKSTHPDAYKEYVTENPSKRTLKIGG